MARILDEAGNMPHHQCQFCNEFNYGPHDKENPGYQVVKVETDPETGEDHFVSNDESRDRNMSLDEKNVSHSACPKCAITVRDQWMRELEEIRSRRKAAAAAAPAEQPEDDSQ